jgi:phosphohistidine phosphatase SixA
MRILLMRHAEAAPGIPDESRRLTPYGEASLRNRPAGLQLFLDDVTHIFVSPYQRTQQTLNNLLPVRDSVTLELITPEGEPGAVLDFLQTLPDESSVLLVTHMPLVGRLFSLLVEGSSRFGVGFVPAQLEVIDCDLPAAGLGRSTAQFIHRP